MAPKKRPNMEQPTTRVTRSSTRRVNSKPNYTDPDPPKPKRAKKTTPKSEPKPVVNAAVDSGSKCVVIEHCTQCNQFKIRAVKVKEGLENGVPGLEVRVNPEKPRRGCFEIREVGENGEKFVSLLDMKRPFGPMKALDMDKVISDIIEKIK
nr:PREDICTED: selenoprotein H-like [Nicotiana tabacum]